MRRLLWARLDRVKPRSSGLWKAQQMIPKTGVKIAAAFALRRQDTNRRDAFEIVATNLVAPIPQRSAPAMNTMRAIGELGESGRAFSTTLRQCLTNSCNGRELDVMWRALAVQACWRVEHSNEGIGPYFSILTNLPPDSADTTLLQSRLAQMERGAYHLREVDGFSEEAKTLLDQWEKSATEDEREHIERIRGLLSAAPENQGVETGAVGFLKSRATSFPLSRAQNTPSANAGYARVSFPNICARAFGWNPFGEASAATSPPSSVSTSKVSFTSVTLPGGRASSCHRMVPLLASRQRSSTPAPVSTRP